MNTSGYSGKPLVAKLGYLPGSKVLVIDAPDAFEDYLLSEGIEPTFSFPVDWLHIFCISNASLEVFLDATDFSFVNKGFWVSWPKKSASLKTNITEQFIRDSVLPLGWVDTKVCAIDETWSGLKFLRRKA